MQRRRNDNTCSCR
ncbi:MAG: hypothetical protein DRP60_16485 [Spirochaetes bacterium]|nr:MAG: hypothetical protein DRP60_16485 [Spirochaetota bacterium]RKX72642.1 MAG: hypothetical protein DRP49_08730 [Spirochaetota bacterium]